ncbi:MAG: DNA polymerase IV [Nocardioidaceae bacterium]
MTDTPILHIDMDAFFASVSIRHRPELRDVPVVIGAGGRGVVLSATYPARACGVHSGMPMRRALRLCPRAVVVSPDSLGVQSVSSAVMETFRSVTPLVRALSIDEAFLDVSGAARRFGSPEQIGEQLRARIADEQGITCSVGVAPITTVAKIASELAKPDGLLVVRPDEVLAFLHPLPIEALWGVGKKTAARLHRLELVTVADLAHTPVSTLQHALGPVAGAHLHRLAWGAGSHTVTPRASIQEPERTMGHQETFGRDTDDPILIRRELLRLSTRVAARMRRGGVVGRVVVITVRFSDFRTITRSRTLRETTDLAADIYAAAAELFAELRPRARIRLVGVRISGLVAAARAPRQLVLGARDPGWFEAERAVDQAALRFGSTVVRPATLIGSRRP